MMRTMKEMRPLVITLTPGTVVMTLLIIAAAAILLALKSLLLVVLVSVVIASAIEPAVSLLARAHIPRVVAVLLLYTTLLAFLGVFFSFLLPPLLQELGSFVAALPQYAAAFSSGSAGVPLIEGGGVLDTLRGLQATFSASASGIVGAVTGIFGGVVSFILVIVLSFYFAAQERGIDDFLTLVTPPKYRHYILDLWHRSQVKIGRWLQGQIVLSLIIGVLVYAGLTLMRVEYALLFALLAAILELIPVFGSILAAIPAVLVAFGQGGTTLALLVIGYYIIINQFQGNVVYPLVVQKILGVPPLLVILALLVGAQLGGFLGMVLAVPIAAVLREFINDYQRDRGTGGDAALPRAAGGGS